MKTLHLKLGEAIHKFRNQVHEIPLQILEAKPLPDKWSKKEILGHLIDSARYNLMRFTEIMDSQAPYVVSTYQQDELVRINQYQQQEFSTLTLLWQGLNSQIYQVVGGFTKEDFLRPVLVNGEQKNLLWLFEDYVNHLEHHLAQILQFSSADRLRLHYHITSSKAAGLLALASSEFVDVLKFGDLEVEYYQPVGTDKQQPHTRDEIYVIAQGNSEFVHEDNRYQVKENDVLFVKAHEKHRFINFSSDFATWVFFFGYPR